MVEQTSLDAYECIQKDNNASSQRGRIYVLIKESDGITRQEISILLNIPINAVCGRVRELMLDLKVYKKGVHLNKYTGKANAALHVY